MIILLSPAKNMDFETPLPSGLEEFAEYTEPQFSLQAGDLVRDCVIPQSPASLQKIMGISPGLAAETAETYRLFDQRKGISRPALFAYAGAVFQNMKVHSFDPDALVFARDHLRILSALYGYLSPLDRIRPYRLDMKTRIIPEGSSSLADFWRQDLTDALVRDLERQETPFVLNLASAEFSKVLDKKQIPCPFVTVDFKEEREGKLKTIGTYAKMARGNMVHQILTGQIADPEELKALDVMGYRYAPEKSSPLNWLFIRES